MCRKNHRLPAISQNLSPPLRAHLSWSHPIPYRGVSDQHLLTWNGERWPGNDITPEMQRDGPAVQAADVPARPLRGPLGTFGSKRWLGGLQSGRRERLPEMEVHRGRCGANLANTARGTPKDWRTCGTTGLRQASMSRGVEARGSIRTLGVPRALGSFPGERKWEYGLPGAAQRIRAMALALTQPAATIRPQKIWE